MRLEQVEQLLEQVGPLLDPYELTYFPGENSWGIRLDEETDLFLDYVPDDRLYVSCELGTPAGDRTRLYEVMLTFNYLWHSSEGARLCLDAPGGDVVLVRDILLSALDATSLCATLRAFAKSAADWRRVVLRPDEGPQTPEPLQGDPGMMNIRI